MTAVCRALGLARSNVHALRAKSPSWIDHRCDRAPHGDDQLLADIREQITELPSYGYRRACALVNRKRASSGALRVLPRALFTERYAIADACEPLLDAEPSAYLRMFGLLSTALTWIYTKRQESGGAAERAVARAREHGRLTGDRRYLYVALTGLVYAMALRRDLESMSIAFAEMQDMENTGCVSKHLALYWGSSAKDRVGSLTGDHAERLRALYECIGCYRDAGDAVLLPLPMAALIDCELAAGNAQAAATLGRTLLSGLEMSSRDEQQLDFARCNLCAALLATDLYAEARAVAEAGWCHARRFELHTCWADYLALLAALEQRFTAAARLCVYPTAAYAAAVESRRQANESAAFDRASRLANTALSITEFERLHAEGHTLRDEAIAAIAFGNADL